MLDRVEEARIGEAHCLYRPSTGAIVMLNADAFENWQAFKSGGRADPDWHAAGLVGLANPSPARSPVAMYRSDHPSPALDATYGTVGRAVRVHCMDAVLGSLLAAALLPLKVDSAIELADLSILNSADGFDLVLGDSGIERGLPRAIARRRVLDHVFASLAPVADRSALLHASAVRIDGRTVLLAGESGSGKTTLTAALVAAGADFLGDDLVALNRDGRRVLGLPTALSIKEGSWPVVRELFPELADQPVLVSRGIAIRYLPLAFAREGLTEWEEASTLVFPSYEPDAKLSCAQLSPEAALALLIRSGTDPDGTPRRIAPLARFASETPAIQLVYGDLKSAVVELAQPI